MTINNVLYFKRYLESDALKPRPATAGLGYHYAAPNGAQVRRDAEGWLNFKAGLGRSFLRL